MLYLELQRNGRASHLLPAMRCRLVLVGLVTLQLLCFACGDLDKPKSEPYYAGTAPPRKQEFRWSNGKLPKTADPALAAVPPETDLVRAIFEGLTEIDPRTLKERPAAAESWRANEDFTNWTFRIRPEARWSNGTPVTAEDFVRSWKRLGEAGDVVVHRELLKNIVGFPLKKKQTVAPLPANPSQETNREAVAAANQQAAAHMHLTEANSNTNTGTGGTTTTAFGVSAPDTRTLQVSLIAPDKDFAKLVAHPIFRPVPNADGGFDKPFGPGLITNGAFRVGALDGAGLTLERSESYWNRAAVKLERVRFVAAENAEHALAAYKAGEIDAVTNADFEPLALKLLEPFEDFRRRTHAAINFYEINHEKAPFDDRRVREALAISIERERLTEGEMEGLTAPALSFLPFGADADVKIVQDKERARDLFDEAGFANGKDFPVMRLVVNRNDTQQRVARAIARMWKQNLNIETEVIVKENAELETARLAGDYDLIRRGEVFPSADELMSILAILKPPQRSTESVPTHPGEASVPARDPQPETAPKPEQRSTPVESPDITMSEANAMYELWAIPIYFPTSYSLVKPYVSAFEMSSLDAPVLSDVSIDADWQPK